MAIDTAAKRRNAIATRRLPWFRRFAVSLPDGSVDAGDRYQLAFVYRGIVASAASVSHGTAEWTMQRGLLHHTLAGAPAHWSMSGEQLHYTMPGSPVHFTFTDSPLHWTFEQ
jgi:hypothetical protein